MSRHVDGRLSGAVKAAAKAPACSDRSHPHKHIRPQAGSQLSAGPPTNLSVQSHQLLVAGQGGHSPIGIHAAHACGCGEWRCILCACCVCCQSVEHGRLSSAASLRSCPLSPAQVQTAMPGAASKARRHQKSAALYLPGVLRR